MTKFTDLVVSHDSLISLHVQLHNQLRRFILSRRWPAGTRIPSESQLTQHLKISRSTVRLALHMAEVEGLIERTRGRGTFVAYHTRPSTRLIAFVATDLNTDSQILILKGAESQARADGYRIIFTNASSHHEELRILNTLQEDHIDGILLWPRPPAWQENNRALYERLVLPTVLLDRPVPGLDYIYVTSDNYNGASMLMDHLLELGHRDIVFLCHHQLHLLPVAERFRAYQDKLLAAAGISPEPWLIGNKDDEIGADHVLQAYDDADMPLLKEIQFLVTQRKPTAIFAVNDYMAALAIRALRLLQLQIPHNISVAGFDDADLSVHMDVPLTTVSQDTFEIGCRAAQLLINQIENPAQSQKHEFVPTQLRVRESTAVPLPASNIERG